MIATHRPDLQRRADELVDDYCARLLRDLEDTSPTQENATIAVLDIQDDDVRLDHIPDIAECRQLLRQFKTQQFWPNVYHVNDHGNVDLLAIGYNGARIVRSWV